MSTANVRSVDALKQFKIALITYAEEAKLSLDSVAMEVRRTRDWLERDQLTYWRAQVKQRTEQVGMARTELHRRQIAASNSDAMSDTEQKENLRKAKQRLQEAEEKVELIKKTIPVYEHAVAEYNSASQPLGDRIAGSFVNTLASLERMIVAIESYLELTAPSTESIAGSFGTGSSGSSGSGSSSKKAATASDGDSAPAETPAPASPTAATETAEIKTGNGQETEQKPTAAEPAASE